MSTNILNQTEYGKLPAKARPRVIRSDDDLARFTQVLLSLDELEHPSREEEELAELLTTLVERYEAEHYSLPPATPTELIQFLLEQRGQSAKDLWSIIGSKGNTSEILSGKRKIGITTATRLGEFFHVPPALFVGWKTSPSSATQLPKRAGLNTTTKRLTRPIRRSKASVVKKKG
jgi:HTH-type transcriptional regulator/antitoxin HigA